MKVSIMLFFLSHFFSQNLNNSFFFVDYLKNYENRFYFGLPIIKDNKKYNAAAQISLNKANQYHYKSKLVPGPELTPFSSSLQPLLDFSGLSLQLGGLDKGDSINVFSSTDSVYCVAPCYMLRICFS